MPNGDFLSYFTPDIQAQLMGLAGHSVMGPTAPLGLGLDEMVMQAPLNAAASQASAAFSQPQVAVEQPGQPRAARRGPQDYNLSQYKREQLFEIQRHYRNDPAIQEALSREFQRRAPIEAAERAAARRGGR